MTQPQPDSSATSETTLVQARPARQRRGQPAAIAKRREQALGLRLLGMSEEAIATHLGFRDGRQVRAALKTVIEKIGGEQRDQMIWMESHRLDELYAALVPGIKQGKPRNVEVAIKVMERRARMLGLDAQGDERPNVALPQIIIEYPPGYAQDKGITESLQLPAPDADAEYSDEVQAPPPSGEGA